jgi:hypothetical protein
MSFDVKSASRRERKEPASTAHLLYTPRGWRRGRPRMDGALQPKVTFRPCLQAFRSFVKAG